ncbi:auxin-responsive protein SAUR32-like isoform X1 [Zingiber officinale]|uniref:auxin-responsive protein SAUR32-like isoform X1 n=1 Tax=Zingiber officinale TaxID=94328 RepID=UPI001C4C0BAF|nr:auxin-responsive protein SAUR32-like isoform X1 [Zingiber officinale]XP_042414741.1 auxin-responsive protein SAUR32-like isoform X1 [Zingiber officinale]
MQRETAPAKGTVTVKVGEEQRRFAVPVKHLSHPLFAELLEKAAAEYGFHHSGAVVIPCTVEHFCHVRHEIERDLAALRRHHHHHHHHSQFIVPIWK